MTSALNKIGITISDKKLIPIAEKIFQGIQLNLGDGMALYDTNDHYALAYLATHVKEERFGKRVFFIKNRHINPTNICISGCLFCAFAKKEGDEGSYDMPMDEILSSAGEAEKNGCSELHIVGGLNPYWDIDRACFLLSSIHKKYPALCLKAFTMVEIDYFARKSHISIEDTILRLREAGLSTLPGGGAEIFDENIRKKICNNKINGARWLEIAKCAHRLGLKSNATMLYGHVEKPVHRIKHLITLRETQNETGGFMAFIPLQFNKENTPFSYLPEVSGIENLKMIAISRLMLDNIDHIKTYWIMVGLKIAQISLFYGADDIDGTVGEEKITHEAGARSPKRLSLDEIVGIIRRAERIPIERDSFYRTLKVYKDVA